MRRLAAALAVTALALVATAGPSFADDVSIRKVDTTAFPKVALSVQVSGPTPQAGAFKLNENGKPVAGLKVMPLSQSATPVGIVLVIDTSGSMRVNDKLNQAKAAAKQMIARKAPNEQIAVVAFSDQPRVVLNFTASGDLLTSAIDGLTASGETALYDGVRVGAALFNDRPELQPNLIVLSDGKDTVSTSDLNSATASILTSKASVFTVGLRGGADFDETSLRALANAGSGQYLDTPDPTTLAAKFDTVRSSIENQYELSYQSTGSKNLHIELNVGTLATHADVAAGSLSSGANTRPKVVKDNWIPSGLRGGSVRWVAVLLILIAAALLAFGIALIVVRERSALSTALTQYGDKSDDEVTSPENEGSLAETALVRRAIDTTARFAERQGILEKLESKLEQADLTVRAAEVFFFIVVVLALGVVAGFALLGLLGVLFAVVIFGLGPIAVLNILAGRRMKKFTSQLPDTLQLLSGSLRAGYSLLQGVDAVAMQVENPMGNELGRALSEARLGRPVEDALEDIANRMGSPDFDWAVMAIRIQREVGGNLAELLQTVAETMIARERLRRDVNALTAEGKISAIVLGILPVALAAFLFIVNPDYMKVLFNHTLGQYMLGGSILLALGGYYWMMQMIKIDI